MQIISVKLLIFLGFCFTHAAAPPQQCQACVIQTDRTFLYQLNFNLFSEVFAILEDLAWVVQINTTNIDSYLAFPELQNVIHTEFVLLEQSWTTNNM